MKGKEEGEMQRKRKWKEEGEKQGNPEKSNKLIIDAFVLYCLYLCHISGVGQGCL